MIRLTDLLAEVLEETYEVEEGILSYEKDPSTGAYVRNLARAAVRLPYDTYKNIKAGKHPITGNTPAKKKGSTWKTATGRTGAKNRAGKIAYFKDDAAAKKFASS